VGVKTINTLLAKSGMYPKFGLWVKPEPAFYDTMWVRANSSGILFSKIQLGDEVKKGDLLGAVNNPISNEQINIESPVRGRVLGMALDQFVIPGFAVYHIGIHANKKELIAADAEKTKKATITESIESGTIDDPEPDERPVHEIIDEEGYDDE
jgi:predicted deacylase